MKVPPTDAPRPAPRVHLYCPECGEPTVIRSLMPMMFAPSIDEITHTDPEIVDPAVIESLKQVCLKLRGPGYYNLGQRLRLVYDAARFESVVHEVFDDLLFDFCTRIVEHRAE